MKNQFVSVDDYDQNPARWEVGNLGLEQTLRIMSRKRTEAIWLGLRTMPAGLALSRIGREPWQTSIRAAAVSATQILVQRAALELDLAPEEFEALEPRLRTGLPLLQIADFLVNGAGFCRRLAETEQGGPPLVVRLVRSVLEDPDDPLVQSFFESSHRLECTQSCYRCLQRYGNRSYHGLLDWRLGLSFLRAMIDVNCRFGLDGDWAAHRELEDWPSIARVTAEELARLQPVGRETIALGHQPLSGVRVRRNGGHESYILVHPFWRLNASQFAREPFNSIKTTAAHPVYFIDLFDAARRPVRALEGARLRPLDD